MNPETINSLITLYIVITSVLIFLYIQCWGEDDIGNPVAKAIIWPLELFFSICYQIYKDCFTGWNK